MTRLKLLKLALDSLARTSWGRITGDPVVESWPFKFEFVWRMIRTAFERGTGAPPEKVRRAQEEMARDPSQPVERRRAEVGGVDCEWFLRPGSEGPSSTSSAVVYLHGGGYFFGSTDTHADFLTRLAYATELPVLGVNYRLCPEHTVTDARDDVVAVWHALLEEGWSADRLALAGDSAGGGLAISTSVALRDEGTPLPAALGLLSPWVDMHCTSESFRRNRDTDYMTAEMVRRVVETVLVDRDPDDPVASPIYADLRDLPPTLVQAGGAEVLADDCRRLADAMEEAGVAVTYDEWDDMVHVFQNFAHLLPDAEQALDELADFLVGHVDEESSRQ